MLQIIIPTLLLGVIVAYVLGLFGSKKQDTAQTTATTTQNQTAQNEIEEEEEEENATRSVRRLKNKLVGKRTQAPASPKASEEATESPDENENNDDFIEDDDEEETEEAVRKPKSRAERVQAAKALKKQEKEKMKQMRQQMVEQQQKKREEEEKRQEEIELKRQEAERQRKEELMKQKEEEQKKKQAEYDEWRHMFEVDASGEATDLSEGSTLLQQFIEYIKENKVVILEEVAAHFQIRTEQVIDRIKSLEEEGVLTGLLDERGKFIYITKDELDSVVKFIKQRGRVSIRELARESNKLIQLTSSVKKEAEEEIKFDE